LLNRLPEVDLLLMEAKVLMMLHSIELFWALHLWRWSTGVCVAYVCWWHAIYAGIIFSQSLKLYWRHGRPRAGQCFALSLSAADSWLILVLILMILKLTNLFEGYAPFKCECMHALNNCHKCNAGVVEYQCIF
jgi:hypothetical protein